jgi:hypothetical protein
MPEVKFQTSFIPKKPIAEEKPKRGMSLFLFLSILVFFVAVGIAGYVYLEKQLLIKNITGAQNVISTNKGSFDTATIDSIVELNARIGAAQTLLGNHVSISPVFNFLNQATLVNVRFKDFTFSGGTDSSGQQTVSIKMDGTAKDFQTVALQAAEFGKSDWRNIVRDVTVSNFNLNQDGSVSFLITATIVPSFLSYNPPAQSNQ